MAVFAGLRSSFSGGTPIPRQATNWCNFASHDGDLDSYLAKRVTDAGRVAKATQEKLEQHHNPNGSLCRPIQTRALSPQRGSACKRLRCNDECLPRSNGCRGQRRSRHRLWRAGRPSRLETRAFIHLRSYFGELIASWAAARPPPRRRRTPAAPQNAALHQTATCQRLKFGLGRTSASASSFWDSTRRTAARECTTEHSKRRVSLDGAAGSSWSRQGQPMAPRHRRRPAIGELPARRPQATKSRPMDCI